LGCGWLGLPLAKHFLKKGHTVKGSTTTSTKKSILSDSGIQPYVFSLGKNTSIDIYKNFLSESDVIIINFPPKRTTDIVTTYQNQIKSIIPYIKPSQKVLFVSSTSVYQNTNYWVTEALEAKPEKESGKAVLAVENILKSEFKDNLTVVRFSGLIGYDRLPGKFLANKKEVSNGKAPINVIHQDDCIGLISSIVSLNCWGETINGCADKHPLRETYYTLAAQKIGVPPPLFRETLDLKFKKISNLKSKELLQFTYTHSDPLKLIAY